MSNIRNIATAALLAATFAAPAFAGPATGPNLLADGDFSQVTTPTGTPAGTSFQFGQNGAPAGGVVSGWTANGGYNLLFNGATSTTISADTTYSPGSTAANPKGSEKLYGPAGGDGLSGFTNFVALDADPAIANGVGGGISTSTALTLVTGAHYQLSFYWAGGQLQSESGATTENVTATLGTTAYDNGGGQGQSYTTTTVSNLSGGFTGWMLQTFTFTAVSTSEFLSFLSYGTPSGLPPVVTLANVQLAVLVPEPMSLSVLGAGLVGLGWVRRRRSQG